MSSYQQIAEHLYTEAAGRMQGKVAEAFKLQRTDLLSHIEATIQTDGPQMVHRWQRHN